MKNLLSLVLITLFIFTSCQVENDDIQDSIENADLELSISKNQTPLHNTNRIADDHSELRRNMLWISYIALETIMESNAAKYDFVNRIGQQDRILLNDLLGPGIAIGSPFKQKFTEILIQYIDSNQIPCTPLGNGSQPPPPLGNLDDTPGFTDDDISNSDRNTSYSPATILSIFDGILNFECVEIFLPYERVSPFIPIREAVSTAHHLQDESFYSIPAYVRNESPIYFTCGINRPTPTHVFSFTLSSLSPVDYDGFESSTVIMVRPFQDTSSRICDYSEYGNIDFTEFLN